MRLVCILKLYLLNSILQHMSQPLQLNHDQYSNSFFLEWVNFSITISDHYRPLIHDMDGQNTFVSTIHVSKSNFPTFGPVFNMLMTFPTKLQSHLYLTCWLGNPLSCCMPPCLLIALLLTSA